MAIKVLVTDFVFGDLDGERAILEPLGCELVEAPGTSEAELIAAVDGAQAMLVCFAQVSEPVVAAAAASGCKVIARYGAGYDNVDVAAARRHGIVVTYVPDYCFDEVADHTLALLLSLARRIVGAARAVGDGAWRVPHGEVRRLAGRTIGVIGLGAVGRRVISRVQPLGLRVVAFDPYISDWDVPARRATSFEDAVGDADFVTLHAPLTAATRHIVDERAIAAMRSAPILVNTARGGLVDTDAALAALDRGALGGLGLDVTEQEPLPADHPLRTHPRAVLTPHMAFYSVEAQAELQRRAAQEVARALRGE
ncbi:MAG: C-terminal binding protein, partial [Solirubrobacteraceae bacterium]|nr:C-terminal binding protein [Solirubrobacteraceae bacterium]